MAAQIDYPHALIEADAVSPFRPGLGAKPPTLVAVEPRAMRCARLLNPLTVILMGSLAGWSIIAAVTIGTWMLVR